MDISITVRGSSEKQDDYFVMCSLGRKEPEFRDIEVNGVCEKHKSMQLSMAGHHPAHIMHPTRGIEHKQKVWYEENGDLTFQLGQTTNHIKISFICSDWCTSVKRNNGTAVESSRDLLLLLTAISQSGENVAKRAIDVWPKAKPKDGLDNGENRRKLRGALANKKKKKETGVGHHKMVLVVRTDIGMSKGKAVSLCVHAALSCYKKAAKQSIAALEQWEARGCPEDCLKVESEEDLLGLAVAAREASIICEMVKDDETVTVLGIGPAPVEQMDMITRHLKFY